jgi:hypothetical protein
MLSLINYHVSVTAFGKEMVVKKRRLLNIILVTTGFILSPLTWWNDLAVNIPLAYLFSLPFSIIDETLFLPSFVFGYWLTNLLGFLLMHWGGEGLLYKERSTISVKHSLYISLIYSIIVIILVLLGWLAPPTEYLQYMNQ